MPDCAAAQKLLERSTAGLAVSDEELERALVHVAGCGLCSTIAESSAGIACGKVESELPNYAQALREGAHARRRWPALARHVDSCDRCAEVLAELVQEPDSGPEPVASQVEPQALFQRALAMGLSDPDPIVRERAARRLAELGSVEATARTRLEEVAERDPVAGVRAAASAAVARIERR